MKHLRLISVAAIAVCILAGATPALAAAPAQGWDQFHLSRAVSAWADGDLHQVVADLSEIDISRESVFAEADRCAFLLGEAYLALGDRESFFALASVSGSESGSPYRQWISWRALALGSVVPAPADFDAAPLLTASLLLENSEPHAALDLLDDARVDDDLEAMRLHLLALAQDASSQASRSTRERLAKRDPKTDLDRELIAGARLALAIDDLENGRESRELLESVPPGSRYREVALQMLALLALDEGRDEDAQNHLDELIAREGAGSLHREALLLRGSLDMDRSEFTNALTRFEQAEADFESDQTLLEQLAAGERSDEAWAQWNTHDTATPSLRPEDPSAIAARLVGDALDLTGDEIDDPETGLAGIPAASGHFARFTPTDDEREDIAAVSAQMDAIRVQQARLDHDVARAHAGRDRQLRYLEVGSEQTNSSLAEMDRTLRALEIRLAEVERTLAAMDSVQADATARIVERTRRVIEELDRDRIFLGAMRHFHVEGPRRDDPAEERSLIAAETALANELADLASQFGVRMSALVDRSFDEHLEPRIAQGTRTLHARLTAERARAARIALELDSLSTTVRIDPALVAQRDALSAEATRLALEESSMRQNIARQVAARGQRALTAEREALDYHLADAAFERAIELALDPATNENPAVVRPARVGAIARLDSFLVRHPESFARAESRFRLADLRLLQARDEFQIRMAEFLGESPDGDQLNDRALAPFVDTTAAADLYRQILDEDPGFAHRDAALFSLGMILSDDGDPDGVAQLETLVADYPASDHAQEAWLRLGDERFASKDFAGAIPRLESASAGADASLSAIALYKLGWSHYEQDDFLEAADGFRRLMDLYATHEDLARSTDLRDEAEEYLVHSLSRGGGAGEFASYFDRLGGRDYETRILASMGALLKSYSLYEESIACDQLWLERYPADPAALDLAGRMVDSYGRDNRSDESRDVRLALAPGFMPGGAWYAANDSTELREAGATFAQKSYREAAVYSHQKARESESHEDWSRAHGHYETYLSHWQDAQLDYQAGEAAAELGMYPDAIAHFSVAAADTASFARDASWQRVATADQWYESAADDSLATKVLKYGDAFLGEYPDADAAADLRWRQAQLAYRHGFDLDAATRFEGMATHHPQDARAPAGLRLRGDALHRTADYEAAALAYEHALRAATAAGQDSLAAELGPVIPTSWYQNAESVAEARNEREAAPLFVDLARRHPDFEYAGQALYRGGLGYLATDDLDLAIDALGEIMSTHPESEYARDAAVQIAQAHDEQGNGDAAALAYANFSRQFPQDPDAPSALLKSADLSAASGDLSGAESLQSEFLDRYPNETDAVMEIRENRARRELEGVGAAGLAGLITGAGSDLGAYLELAKSHPELASAEILAEVDFLEAEAIQSDYLALSLDQPLDASIEAKKDRLETLLTAWGECTAHGVRAFTQASAFRIGEALIAFGDALVESERPAGLNEDELFAYDEVLDEQSWAFYDRGEQAWNELLQQNPVNSEDPQGWLSRTREALWPRVARRFMHQPTAEYPLIEAEPPSSE